MGCMRNSHSPFSFFVGFNLGRALTKTFIHIPFVVTPYYYICKKNKRDKISLIT